jgi:simple sugar transport system permease protein
VGVTFVILSNGIDLSVGAVIGCTSITLAALIQQHEWHPLAAIALVLVCGAALGAGMGSLIQFFGLPPFLVTLGGLFFCRGLALLVSAESISITHGLYQRMSLWSIPLGGGATLGVPGLCFLAVLGVGIYIATWTRLGRNTYAVGGNETSAMLMGLPVSSTKIILYSACSFCSALAGVASTVYMGSGNALNASGLELDAIAAVVVGGTLLTGGSGYVLGTLLGVLVFGIIQTGITFQGTLSSWWTKIAVGALLLVFIVLQKLIQRKGSAS